MSNIYIVLYTQSFLRWYIRYAIKEGGSLSLQFSQMGGQWILHFNPRMVIQFFNGCSLIFIIIVLLPFICVVWSLSCYKQHYLGCCDECVIYSVFFLLTWIITWPTPWNATSIEIQHNCMNLPCGVYPCFAPECWTLNLIPLSDSHLIEAPLL